MAGGGISSLRRGAQCQQSRTTVAEVRLLNTDNELTFSVTRSLQVQLQIFMVLLAVNATVWLLANNFGLMPVRGGLSRMFSFDNEWNVPTWYSFLLLLQASLFCFLSRRRESASFFWGLLTLVFLVLSVDELFSFHERLIEPIRDWLGVSGFLYFAWIIPGSFLVLVLAALGAGWLRTLPAPTRRGFLIAAGVYLSGVLAMESVGGWYLSQDPTRLDTVYWAITTTEESLEMLGLIVFGYYAALHLVTENGLSLIRIRV